MAILAPTFNFRDLPVHDLEGVTRNFEQLRTFLLPEAWKKLSTLGYKNAWKDEAATPGEYRKNQFGTVELRGTITGGESGKEAFTLPLGYRPTKTEELGVLASLRVIAELNITTAGVVVPINSVGAGSEVKTYCTLHTSFSVE